MKTVENLLVISQMAIKSHVFGNNWGTTGTDWERERLVKKGVVPVLPGKMVPVPL